LAEGNIVVSALHDENAVPFYAVGGNAVQELLPRLLDLGRMAMQPLLEVGEAVATVVTLITRVSGLSGCRPLPAAVFIPNPAAPGMIGRDLLSGSAAIGPQRVLRHARSVIRIWFMVVVRPNGAVTERFEDRKMRNR